VRSKFDCIYLFTAAAKDHSSADCLLVAVMSHGETGHLFSRDYKYPATELWSHFTGDKCHSLIGKPKIFFIQVMQHVLTYFRVINSLHFLYQRTPFISRELL
jgi:hypothetical protein